MDYSVNAGMRYLLLKNLGLSFTYVLSLRRVEKTTWNLPGTPGGYATIIDNIYTICSARDLTLYPMNGKDITQI